MADPNIPIPPPPHKDELRGRSPPISLLLVLFLVLAVLLIQGLAQLADEVPTQPQHADRRADAEPGVGSQSGASRFPGGTAPHIDPGGEEPIPGRRDRVTVDGDRLVVPVDDLAYGDTPEQPVPAGTYELMLVNYDTRAHTLVNDALGVSLRASEPSFDRDASTARTRVELSAGTYTFYCEIPNHRGSGMEFDLHVTSARGSAAS